MRLSIIRLFESRGAVRAKLILLAILATLIGVHAEPAGAGDTIERPAGVKVAQAEPQEPQGIFQGIGIVTAIGPRTGVLTIHHEDIKGLMPGMIMTFRVSPPALSAGLRPGDKIEFSLDARNYTITSVRLIARTK